MLIVVISHRPSAIKLSDEIILLKEGEVIANGRYDNLYTNNNDFRSLMEKGFGEKTI